MKYLGLLCLCYLSCGTHANFFDDLKHAAQNTVNAVSNTAHQVGSAVGKVAQQVAPVAQHYGSQALSSALDVLTTDGVKTLVSAGVSAAATGKTCLKRLFRPFLPGNAFCFVNWANGWLDHFDVPHFVIIRVIFA